MIPFATPHGLAAYEEHLRGLHIRYGGDTWAMKQRVLSGNAVPSLLGTHEATKSASGVTPGSTGPVIHGQPGTAYAFDAATGTVVNTGLANANRSAYTLAAWGLISGSGGSGNGRILETHISAGMVAAVYHNYASGNLRGTVNGAATVLEITAPTGWFFTALVANYPGSAQPVLYVNETSSTASSTYSDATPDFVIGNGLATLTRGWNGSIAYATWIPAALTAADIHTLYNLGTRGQ